MEHIKQYLEKHGIKNATEIIYNPTYERLFQDEMSANNEGFEQGILTESGAVAVKQVFLQGVLLRIALL